MGKLAALNKALKRRKAFHGSPHDFDKFSTKHIGTGEGAQAYGHGMYFTSKEDIAKHYRDALSAQQNMQIPRTRAIGAAISKPEMRAAKASATSYRSTLKSAGVPESHFKGFRNYHDFYNHQSKIKYLDELHMKQRGPEIEKRIKDFESKYQLDADFRREVDAFMGDDFDGSWAWLREPHQRAYRGASDVWGKEASGKLYTVEIPDESHMLDWDKPLSEQPESVQRAINQLPDPKLREKLHGKTNVGTELNGSQIYDEIQRYFAPNRSNIFDGGSASEGAIDASAELRELGIPGITYKGGTSGERNFVVFDDELVDITQKGQIAPALLPAVAAVGAAAEFTRRRFDKAPLWQQAHIEQQMNPGSPVQPQYTAEPIDWLTRLGEAMQQNWRAMPRNSIYPEEGRMMQPHLRQTGETLEYIGKGGRRPGELLERGAKAGIEIGTEVF